MPHDFIFLNRSFDNLRNEVNTNDGLTRLSPRFLSKFHELSNSINSISCI